MQTLMLILIYLAYCILVFKMIVMGEKIMHTSARTNKDKLTVIALSLVPGYNVLAFFFMFIIITEDLSKKRKARRKLNPEGWLDSTKPNWLNRLFT